jgi:hypothetical protein
MLIVALARVLSSAMSSRAAAASARAIGYGPLVNSSRLVRKLVRRLSDALGEEVFRASGLGGPDDTEQLRQQAAALEQELLDVRHRLEERNEELEAARATNRGVDGGAEPGPGATQRCLIR